VQEEQGLYLDYPEGSKQERPGASSLLPQARPHKGESEKCGSAGNPTARRTTALINRNQIPQIPSFGLVNLRHFDETVFVGGRECLFLA
jgi:hypothetical protein